MTYPPGPAVPWPAHLRGRRAIQCGVGLLVAAVVGFVLVGVVLARAVGADVDGFQRVAVWSQTGMVHFSHFGRYVAYYEAADVDDDTDAVPLIGIMLTGPTGERVSVNTPYGGHSDGTIEKMTYSHDGHHGIAMYQFDITRPGDYRVRLIPNPHAAPDARVAFGTSVDDGPVVAGVIGLLALVTGVAGLIVLVVGLVRRNDHRKQLLRARGFGYGMAYPPAPHIAGGPPLAPWTPPPAPPPPGELRGDPVDPNQLPW